MKYNWLLPLILQYLTQETSASTINPFLNISDSSSDEPFLTTNLTSSEEQLPSNSKLEIDLDSCICMQNTDGCDIVITRSIFMVTVCPQDFTFCCTGRLKQLPTLPVHPSDLLSSDPNSFLIDMEEEEEEEEGEDVATDLLPPPSAPSSSTTAPHIYNADEAIPSEELPTPNKRPKRRCTCRPRAECPEEYKDYSFGFGCSHNTVRCCEPAGSSNITNNNRLIFVQKPTPPVSVEDDGMFEEESFSDPQCYCLPPQDCERIEENVVWRREDTLCPHNLVKCCGSLNTGGRNEDLSEEKVDTAPFEGQGGFHQPIPLPELKIPMTEEYSDENEDKYDSSRTRPTLPPPELPTYYNYQPPKYYAGYYNPGFRSEDRPHPDISGLPWEQKYPQDTAEYSNHRTGSHGSSYQGNQNGGDSGRRFNSEPSLFDKIAGFLG